MFPYIKHKERAISCCLNEQQGPTANLPDHRNLLCPFANTLLRGSKKSICKTSTVTTNLPLSEEALLASGPMRLPLPLISGSGRLLQNSFNHLVPDPCGIIESVAVPEILLN